MLARSGNGKYMVTKVVGGALDVVVVVMFGIFKLLLAFSLSCHALAQ